MILHLVFVLREVCTLSRVCVQAVRGSHTIFFSPHYSQLSESACFAAQTASANGCVCVCV